jgi:hypothetical protein
MSRSNPQNGDDRGLDETCPAAPVGHVGRPETLQWALPMSANLAQLAKQKTVTVFAVGTAGFVAFFGTITLVALLVANLK